MDYVFITGMFRSGTTLLARMFNAHSRIACASDPMRPLFNSFRYTIAEEEYKRTHSRSDPLDDYFLSNTGLLRKILKADFEVALEEDTRELFQAVKERAMPFSGLWAASLDSHLDFGTYRDFMVYGLDHICAVYRGNKKIGITAFKEVWSNEFIPAFITSFAGAKAVVLIRDPRAVTASNMASGGKYPLFFLIRQWRKLAFLADYLKKEWAGEVHLLKYEDLVEDPEAEVRKLCRFVGVPFEEELLDITNFADGDNKRWRQNTNYGYRTEQRINRDSLDRWRKALKRPELLEIELIARDWMENFDYAPLYPLNALLGSHFSEYRRWPSSELSQWIRPYSFDEKEDIFAVEVAKEKARLLAAYTETELADGDRFLLQIQRDDTSEGME
jgi:hypothetical protein